MKRFIGKGKFYYASGDEYDGAIENGKPHGQGVKTYKKTTTRLTIGT